MSEWLAINPLQLIKGLSEMGLSHSTSLFFFLAFKLTAQEKNSSWAFRWNWSIWKHGGKSLLPPVNLSKNIGCNHQGSHTQTQRQFDHYPVLTISNPTSDLIAPYDRRIDECAFKYTHQSNKKNKLIRMFISSLVSRGVFKAVRKLLR
jgi:hypothetical protein